MVRIACVGGFLGAGKTTGLLQAARNLIERGLKVGVISNDQGSHLVDTSLFLSQGLQTEEVAGGCFCCRFSEFVKHAVRLVDRYHPDIILAEAVGSCTDLAATVYEPLRRFHSTDFELAPLSVLVEPARIQELLGSANQFECSVRYLFEKQLAEAELILLTKTELLSPEQIAGLSAQLQRVVNKIPIRSVSGRTGAGIREWVDQLLSARLLGNAPLDLDYETYGQAEASLGWLNATVDIDSAESFPLAEFGEVVVAQVREQCRLVGTAIAHLKVLLVSEEGSDRISLTTSDGPAVWDGAGSLGLVREASVIINARAGVNPEELRRVVERALQSAADNRGVSATVLNLESFAPLAPERPVLRPASLFPNA